MEEIAFLATVKTPQPLLRLIIREEDPSAWSMEVAKPAQIIQDW